MKSQNEIIREHLEKYGSITSMDAIMLYGITRLSARIFVLRENGFPIVTENVTKETKYGKTTFARYYLEKPTDVNRYTDEEKEMR